MNWYADPASPSGLSSVRLKRPVGCIGDHGYYQVSCRRGVRVRRTAATLKEALSIREEVLNGFKK